MSFESDAPTPDLEELYALNFQKIQEGCNDRWFGSTSLKKGASPRLIYINESEPLHFVQILYILKEQCWDDNRWILFTKGALQSIVNAEEKIYLENNVMFGRQFVNEFPTQIEFFLKRYCDVMGEY
tara:strand:- start:352 stop:729 length:378 start_codon:yes stop_codon:yes gene_type:complete